MAQVIKSDIYDKIDLSERYMVCGLYNDACSLASSQIQNLRTFSLEPITEIELSGMMESAGMVFVQSLKELGRTPDLFAELKLLFGSVEAIPIQVFLTGTCMQISEGITSNLTTIFEDFLEKWRYVDNDHYEFPEKGQNSFKCPWQSILDSEKYLEVAEVFAIIFLGRVLRQPELAISWTEKSDLPEDKRQDMLRRLRSIYLSANYSSSFSPATVQTVEKVDETPSGAEAFGKSTNSSTQSILVVFCCPLKVWWHSSTPSSRKNYSSWIGNGVRYIFLSEESFRTQEVCMETSLVHAEGFDRCLAACILCSDEPTGCSTSDLCCSWEHQVTGCKLEQGRTSFLNREVWKYDQQCFFSLHSYKNVNFFVYACLIYVLQTLPCKVVMV